MDAITAGGGQAWKIALRTKPNTSSTYDQHVDVMQMLYILPARDLQLSAPSDVYTLSG